MNFKKESIFVLSLFFSISILAQFPRYYVPTFDGNDPLEMAYVGGLIAPQFSEVDLNNDGIEDLYIFDKAGSVHLTFINEGTPNQVDYIYAPHYEQFFPVITDWALENNYWAILRDYDGDGIKDMFAYSDAPGIDGMIAYKGKYVAGAISFDRLDFTHLISVANVIPFPTGGGYTNLYVTGQDYPAIDDIDGDGDLDILTFAVGGGHVYYFQNQSIELGYGLDSLLFELEDDCWGRFYESGLSEPIDLSEDPDICSNGFHDPDPSGEVRHAGSTLLTFDNDADGDKELLLGDISFNNLNLLTNTGDGVAYMSSQDTFFPSYNVSAEVQIFPASFYLDVDNDGVKDLLASPNVWKPGENHDVVWRYHNNGANNEPDFQYVQKDFLVREMIDMGREAHPTFVDYNADGLMDMVVGNSYFFAPFGERTVRIYLFENIGTATSPIFELVDEDYLNFSAFDNTGNNSPALTFGDIDNDGDMDVLIGEESGGFYFGENTAGAGNTINIASLQLGYMGLDLGVRSMPQFVDLNRDGKLDIVAGEKLGRMVYFQNDGTPESPIFVPNIDSNTPGGNNIIGLGGVDTRLGWTAGYTAPFFYDFGDEYVLFAGSERGNILKYTNIDNNLDGDFTLLDDFWGDLRPGYRTAPAIVDINNDGRLEMYVGNTRGGITAYKTNLMSDGTPVGTIDPEAADESKIYPNPASEYVQIDFSSAFQNGVEVNIYNAIGQLVYQNYVSDINTSISTKGWGKGMFVIQLQKGDNLEVKKLIVR